MSNRIAKYVILLSLICISSLYGEEEKQFLEWKSVPEAGGYMVEIKDQTGRITREKTKSTRFEVNIPPGVYEHRIGVLNKFGRVSVFTDWIAFEVILSRAPMIEQNSNVKILREKLSQYLVIKGDNFTEAMNVTLLLPSGETVKPEFEFINPREIKIKTENLSLKSGSYTLSLENPRNKKTARKGFLIIAETEQQLAEISRQSDLENQVSSDTTIQWEPALKSAILPGWGQSNQEKKFRSWIFPILMAGAIAYSAQQYSEYNTSLGALDQSRMINRSFLFLDNPVFLPFAIYNYTQVQSNYGESISEYNQFQVSLGIVALLYLLNVSDAAFINSSFVKTNVSELDRKVIPYFKTGTAEPRTGMSSQNIFFPTSIEIGMKFFF